MTPFAILCGLVLDAFDNYKAGFMSGSEFKGANFVSSSHQSMPTSSAEDLLIFSAL
jgi:hypothetical protein